MMLPDILLERKTRQLASFLLHTKDNPAMDIATSASHDSNNFEKLSSRDSTKRRHFYGNILTDYKTRIESLVVVVIPTPNTT